MPKSRENSRLRLWCLWQAIRFGRIDARPPHVLESARRLEEAMLQDAPLLTVARGRFYPMMLVGENGPSRIARRALPP